MSGVIGCFHVNNVPAFYFCLFLGLKAGKQHKAMGGQFKGPADLSSTALPRVCARFPVSCLGRVHTVAVWRANHKFTTFEWPFNDFLEDSGQADCLLSVRL